MGKAVDRAGSPSNHEEGGYFGTDANGSNEYVVHAQPGAESNPSIEKIASVNVFKAANFDDLDKVTSINGTFHTHPDGVVTEGNADFNTIGQKKISTWSNQPSDVDISNAKTNEMGVTGNSYVLAQGNKTAYIYNGNGVQATLPFKQFFSAGIKK